MAQQPARSRRPLRLVHLPPNSVGPPSGGTLLAAAALVHEPASLSPPERVGTVKSW